MEGRELIKMVVKDIESFFVDGSCSIDYVVAPRRSACQKLGNSTRVVIDQNISDFVVSDLPGMLTVLIEVCHELAHYLNRHAIHVSKEEDKKNQEDKSLEIWADFFGAKLIMTLILLGEQVRPTAQKFGYNGLEGLISSLNLAILKFYSSRYEETDKSPIYETKDSRVGLCAAGINSVLDRAGGVNFTRSLKVIAGIHKGTRVIEQNEIHGTYMQDRQSIGVAREIMINLQDDDSSMFEGMDALTAYILGAGTYNVSDADRKKYLEDCRKEFLAQGLILD